MALISLEFCGEKSYYEMRIYIIIFVMKIFTLKIVFFRCISLLLLLIFSLLALPNYTSAYQEVLIENRG
jgi:hypothetical protein